MVLRGRMGVRRVVIGEGEAERDSADDKSSRLMISRTQNGEAQRLRATGEVEH